MMQLGIFSVHLKFPHNVRIVGVCMKFRRTEDVGFNGANRKLIEKRITKCVLGVGVRHVDAARSEDVKTVIDRRLAKGYRKI